MKNIWNTMVMIINNHNDNDVKIQAKILLHQYNTAGGKRIEEELKTFIYEILN